MPAGGMAGDEQSPRIGIEISRMPVDPVERAANILDDRRNADLGAEPVTDADEVDVGGDVKRRDEMRQRFVAAVPIATVHEDENRSARPGAQKEIKLLALMISIRDVQVARKSVAGLLTARHPSVGDRRGIRHLFPVVVFAVQRRLIIVRKDRSLSRHDVPRSDSKRDTARLSQHPRCCKSP